MVDAQHVVGPTLRERPRQHVPSTGRRAEGNMVCEAANQRMIVAAQQRQLPEARCGRVREIRVRHIGAEHGAGRLGGGLVVQQRLARGVPLWRRVSAATGAGSKPQAGRAASVP